MIFRLFCQGDISGIILFEIPVCLFVSESDMKYEVLKLNTTSKTKNSRYYCLGCYSGDSNTKYSHIEHFLDNEDQVMHDLYATKY